MEVDYIDEILKGKLVYPEPEGDGKPLSVPTKSVVIEDTLDGMEADLVSDLGFGKKLTVVYDRNTKEALGGRVERALDSIAEVISVELPGRPHADMETAEKLAKETESADALIAVGSGTINDLCKFTAACVKKPYAVFGTAPSMNGYTSVNASITVDGLKKSLPACAAMGVFLDLTVLAAAPRRMILSGLGDSLCSSTARADWFLSHLIFGSKYRSEPFLILDRDEKILLENPEALMASDLSVMRHLARTLVLSGFGMTICEGSHPASQGEHLIGHYVEMLGSQERPESFHGEQIGVTTLTMARLQEMLLQQEKLHVVPSTRGKNDLIHHFGPDLGITCWEEFSKKRLTSAAAEKLNEKLEREWDSIRERISKVKVSYFTLLDVLRRAGAPTTPEDLHWPKSLYYDAVRYAREIRNRYTFLDLAADGGFFEKPDFLERLFEN